MRLSWKKHTIIFSLLLLTLFSCTACTDRSSSQQKYKTMGIEAMAGGDYATAVDDFNEALSFSNFKVTGQEVDICYYKAAAQYLMNDFTGALETYTALLDFDESNADAFFLRGCLYLNAGESDKAIRDFKSAVSCDEGNFDLYIEIYENLVAMNYSEDAMEFLNLGLEVEGSSAATYVGRGRIYILLGQNDAAIKVLTKAVDKKSNEAKLYLAQIYTSEGDEASATAILEDYIDGDVTSESLNALGDLHMRNGDYEEALEAYEEGLAQTVVTNEKQLKKNRIGALEYTQDWQGAYEACTEFVTEYPADADTLRELVFLTTRVEGPYGEEDTQS